MKFLDIESMEGWYLGGGLVEMLPFRDGSTMMPPLEDSSGEVLSLAAGGRLDI